MAKKLQSLDELFGGRHFEREIIVMCVRWYPGGNSGSTGSLPDATDCRDMTVRST